MFYSVNQIKQLANDTGSYWFSPDSMRFFGSRVGSKVYGGEYFISSEQFDYQSPRLYTIRRATYSDGRLDIDTVGEFQQYATRADAETALKQIIK